MFDTSEFWTCQTGGRGSSYQERNSEAQFLASSKISNFKRYVYPPGSNWLPIGEENPWTTSSPLLIVINKKHPRQYHWLTHWIQHQSFSCSIITDIINHWRANDRTGLASPWIILLGERHSALQGQFGPKKPWLMRKPSRVRLPILSLYILLLF